jgi:hypothetical protein
LILRRFFAAAVLAAPLVAHAQYKIEELVAKGAQVMSAEQLRAAFVGKNLAGLTEQGWDVEYRLIPGGKLEGMMHTQRGSSGVIGTWTINEKNQICGDITSVRWGIRTQRCSWYWRVGDEYYVTNSRADDEAAAKFVDCLLSSALCEGGFQLMRRAVHP